MDLGELENERETLSDFLRAKLKVDITSKGNKVLVVGGENLPPKELKRLVNKFVYHRNLNHKYWVALESDLVKINKFKRSEKHEKRKTKGTPPSTIKHGW